MEIAHKTLIYIKPITKIENFIMEKSLFAGSPLDWVNKTYPKNYSSETLCPFNQKWCKDKQSRLDEWRNAVAYMAFTGSKHVFLTHEDMFDGCPYKCESLCSLYEQRQRD